MHAVLYGITRDQMMARHKSNHVQVAYAPNAADAQQALAAKAAAFDAMGNEGIPLRQRARAGLRKARGLPVTE
jgi:hypothetical protein